MNRHARSPRRKGNDSHENGRDHRQRHHRCGTKRERRAGEARLEEGCHKKKGAPKAKRGAKSKKPAKAPAKKNASDRSNKRADVIALMKRAKGVTLAEIGEATGWQNHTIRGFVSILGSKGGEKIESSKNAHDPRLR